MLTSPLYIISYWSYHDKKSFVGGLRPYKLNEFLKQKGVNSHLVVPKASDPNEFEITENKWIAPFEFIKRAFPPDPSFFWACHVALRIRSQNKNRHFYLLTTCPPNGLVAAGLLLNYLKVNFTWILDFRDLWTGHPIYNPPITKKYIDPWLEREACLGADILIANTDWDHGYWRRIFPFTENKLITVRNGVDSIRINNRTNDDSAGLKFIYAGGTTAGQATVEIGDFLVKLNAEKITASCDFYGEYDDGMEKNPYIHYHGKISSQKVPELLLKYRFGFIYFPVGSEEGGRIAQKFYDYMGAGVIPVCFRASKEMKALMTYLKTGITISSETPIEDAIHMLKKAQFGASNVDLLPLTRDFQFDKIYRLLLSNNTYVKKDQR